jgi:flagellar basal body P-ring protein FlgI
VSALGDASNLTGGTLLVTSLLAADGEVYAVVQGAPATGAIAARGAAGAVTHGFSAVRFASPRQPQQYIGIPMRDLRAIRR